MHDRNLLVSFCLIFLTGLASAADPQEKGTAFPRPKLQIINGTNQPVDIFWLKSESERIPNGSVKAGEQTTIMTTTGHQFELVGRENKAMVKTTSQVTYQGVRFDPPNPDGVPSFYTQSISGVSGQYDARKTA